MTFSSVPLAVFRITEWLADVLFKTAAAASAHFLVLSASLHLSATGTWFIWGCCISRVALAHSIIILFSSP
jgi:hypothetical protein